MIAAATGADQQQYDMDNARSSLCTTGKKAMNLTGIMLWVIRRHFQTADYIKDENLKDYVWASQPNDTTSTASESQIMIEPVTKVTGVPSQFIQQRPAVLVKRNPLRPTKLGFGDWVMPLGAPSVDPDRRSYDYSLDTSNRYEVLVVGSHTVFCIGGTGGEAEALGTEVFYELVEFAQLIRRDMDLNTFKIEGMDAVAKLEESKEHFVVPITATYAYFHAWQLTPELPELNAIGLQLT